MPKGIFEPLACASGYPTEVTAITVGGYALSQYADRTDPYGALSAPGLAIKSKTDVRGIDVKELQDALKKNGAFIRI